LKDKGYELPPFDNGEGLTAQDILNAVDSYLRACEHAPGEGNLDGCFDCYFMAALVAYPNSMCSHKLGVKLEQVIALSYEEGLPTKEEIDKWRADCAKWRSYGYKEKLLPDEPGPRFTYENLALIFNCSKSTVYAAIHKYHSPAVKMVEDVRLHSTARDIALKELIEEEKKKLAEEEKQKNNQTTERTRSTTSGGDNVPQPT
jgi:hypothetical protein